MKSIRRMLFVGRAHEGAPTIKIKERRGKYHAFLSALRY